MGHLPLYNVETSSNYAQSNTPRRCTNGQEIRGRKPDVALKVHDVLSSVYQAKSNNLLSQLLILCNE